DVILIPEIPYRIENVVSHLRERVSLGKPFSIVVVAEGAMNTEEAKLKLEEREKLWESGGKASAGYRIAEAIESASGMETRVTVLGYLQRGGAPCPEDRVLSTRFGTAAADMIFDGRFGNMVALEGTRIVERPLADIAGKLKLVPAGHPIVESARAIGTCMGDS
ncbi:6-phosphofructokinase, partial [Salinispira pacifica]